MQKCKLAEGGARGSSKNSPPKQQGKAKACAARTAAIRNGLIVTEELPRKAEGISFVWHAISVGNQEKGPDMSFSNPTPEQQSKAMACKTIDELKEFAKEEGFALTDEMLESIAGGLGGDDAISGITICRVDHRCTTKK